MDCILHVCFVHLSRESLNLVQSVARSWPRGVEWQMATVQLLNYYMRISDDISLSWRRLRASRKGHLFYSTLLAAHER